MLVVFNIIFFHSFCNSNLNAVALLLWSEVLGHSLKVLKCIFAIITAITFTIFKRESVKIEVLILLLIWNKALPSEQTHKVNRKSCKIITENNCIAWPCWCSALPCPALLCPVLSCPALPTHPLHPPFTRPSLPFPVTYPPLPSNVTYHTIPFTLPYPSLLFALPCLTSLHYTLPSPLQSPTLPYSPPIH